MNLYYDGSQDSNVISLSAARKMRDNIIHLPVAPQLVARTRFSPPLPKSNACLTIEEAMVVLDEKLAQPSGEIDMVTLCGPGDPLATPDITLAALARIKDKLPEVKLGLVTYGIGSGQLARQLAQAGIDYVEMIVEGVRCEIIEKLFAWIRPGTKTLKLSEAAKLLIKEQSSGVSALKFHDITVSIITTLYPGHNITHVAKISQEMVELGADSISLVPYHPPVGVEVELEQPSTEEIAAAKENAAKSLPVKEPVIYSAIGADVATHSGSVGNIPKPSKTRPNVAVVSSNGIEVDLHLGHALQFLIYGPREDGLTCLLETRHAPEPGSGADRWQEVARILKDCFVLLTASAGKSPLQILPKSGLKVHICEDNIEGMVDVLFGGKKKKQRN